MLAKVAHDPDALDLVTRLIEKLAERSPNSRRRVQFD